jgi:DNA invertase Pin-like site-specific DNA recombinase
MSATRPNEIKPTHLARKAVVYVRQSSEHQVVNNRGSADYQRDQARHARSWGWSEDAIEVVDEDLGLSATTSVGRTGYLRLGKEIDDNLVGAVFASDLSRLGRDLSDAISMIDRLMKNDVLLVLDGRVNDFGNSSQLLMAKMVSLFAEHDNRNRREAMERGLVTKARKGQAVSAPPRGYVRDTDGNWEKDPDPAARAAVEKVFRTFQKEHSLLATVKSLSADHILIPRRHGVEGIRWVPPTLSMICDIIHHPAYKGEYHFRRYQIDPRRIKLRGRGYQIRKAPPDYTIIKVNHHEPYLTAEEWQEMQEILKLYSATKIRRNLGPGKALLQGILRCSAHPNMVMGPHYKRPRRDGVCNHDYSCIGDIQQGGSSCTNRISGVPLDRAVGEALLTRMVPPKVEEIRKAFLQTKADEGNEQHRHEIEKNRADKRAALLLERYLCVDPAQPHVKHAIGAKLEEAQKAVAHLARELGTASSRCSVVSEGIFDDLVALCTQFRTLWNAPSTTHRDHKEIIRTLISSVVLEGRTRETAELRIVWTDDGESDTHIVVKLSAYYHRLIGEMAAQGLTRPEIAEQLNAMGARTVSHCPWSAVTIGEVITDIRKREKKTARQGPSAWKCQMKGHVAGGRQ